jgi:DNA-binding MarR family transcriptional regulator
LIKPSLESLIYEIGIRARLYLATFELEGVTRDLSLVEVLILEVLEKKEKTTISGLAAAVPTVSRGTISNALANLWNVKKFVSKTVDPERPGAVTVSLTEKGLRALDSSRKARVRFFKALADATKLDGKETEIFKKGLINIRDFLDEKLNLTPKKGR